MEKPKAYMIAKYSKDDPGILDGIEEGDIILVFENNPVNTKVAVELFYGA